jgi:hypothetical protein
VQKGPIESSSNAGGSTTSTMDVDDRQFQHPAYIASSTFPALLDTSTSTIAMHIREREGLVHSYSYSIVDDAIYVHVYV